MSERNDRHLTGHPSDYGSRTLDETADGEPREDRGSADSALVDEENGSPQESRKAPESKH